jgi:heme/copper-type cytochrome/quinol oxidase subunit 3
MYALPAPPPPAPQRQLLVGVSLAVAAAVMATGSMLAVWALQRRRAIDLEGTWLPDGVVIPEVPSNVMLIAFIGICVFAQWAHYSAADADRGHAILALGCTFLVALLVVNAQIFIYTQMELAIGEGTYQSMFYAITGFFVVLMVAGLLFTTVTAFRYIGGRVADRELLAAHALYWYAMAAVYSGIWFLVYVTK